ncbi:MAG: hypothetical protein ACSLFE_05930 [Gemmatimonadaceae bacterium]
MRKFASVVIASAVLAAPVAAQQGDPNPKCTSQQTETQDACQKAVDLFHYLVPQLGTAVAGGAPTLGQGGTLGGLGHFSIGVRVNGVMGKLPQIQEHQPVLSGLRSSTYSTENQIIPMPTADLALGLFGGLPLGITSVGGLDLLVSASYLPAFEADNIKVEIDGSSVKFGFGARLGLLEESLLVPGVSVSYLRRDLPKLDITARAANDSLFVRDLDIQTTSWRIMASKSFFMFGIAAGGGKDRYKSSTTVAVSLEPPLPLTTRFAGTVPDIEQNVSRTTMFLDLSMNLPFFKIVGEIGQVSGGDVETYNQFDGSKADDSRTYGSIGIRFGF